MSTFQRARSEEQREARRQAILDAAVAMLGEMPVAAITLGALGGRVGLAKSNVLRYFESREAILLTVLNRLLDEVANEVLAALPDSVVADGSPRARVAGTASAVAEVFAARPMFCELLSVHAGVLEHNVSVEAVTSFKRSGYQSIAPLSEAFRRCVPELGEQGAAEAVRLIFVLTGSLWIYSHPSQAVDEAHAADPSLEFIPEGFARAFERSLTLVLLGLLDGARHGTGAAADADEVDTRTRTDEPPTK